MKSIDLNADLGEGDACDDELLRIVSSCNIACGGHAGDAGSMQQTIASAIANNVAIGAHPSYPDRDGFGRVSGFMSGAALSDALNQQVTSLAGIAAQLGQKLTHVKAHGALYNDATADAELAAIIAAVTANAPGSPAMMGMADTAMQRAAEQRGLSFIAEAFVDRAYQKDGSLVPRSEPGAVHTDIAVQTTQALRLATDGEVTARDGSVINVRADTLCIHGDSPMAAEAARAVRDVLTMQGIQIRAICRR